MTLPTVEPIESARRYITDARGLRNRLRRVEGQLRGLERMVDQQRPCIDILTQISATNRALDGVALSLLDNHLRFRATSGALTDDVELAAIITAVTGLIRPTVPEQKVSAAR